MEFAHDNIPVIRYLTNTVIELVTSMIPCWRAQLSTCCNCAHRRTENKIDMAISSKAVLMLLHPQESMDHGKRIFENR